MPDHERSHQNKIRAKLNLFKIPTKGTRAGGMFNMPGNRCGLWSNIALGWSCVEDNRYFVKNKCATRTGAVLNMPDDCIGLSTGAGLLGHYSSWMGMWGPQLLLPGKGSVRQHICLRKYIFNFNFQQKLLVIFTIFLCV